jgi:hypothetical protein
VRGRADRFSHGHLLTFNLTTETWQQYYPKRAPAQSSRHPPSFPHRVEQAVLRWKTERTKALREWWARIAQRRGKPTAVAALARKLGSDKAPFGDADTREEF